MKFCWTDVFIFQRKETPINRHISQILQYTRQISHDAHFETRVHISVTKMVHYGTWNWCIWGLFWALCDRSIAHETRATKYHRPPGSVYVHNFETVKQSGLWSGLGIQVCAEAGDRETVTDVKQSWLVCIYFIQRCVVRLYIYSSGETGHNEICISINLTLKVNTNHSQNSMNLNHGVLHLWSKFDDPGNELSRGQARDWYTHTHTDTHTQATTIPEGQNWPRIKRWKHNPPIHWRDLFSSPGVGVTKAISSVPLFCEFFSIVKTNVSYWISRLYLAGVAAAQLRWHLSNVNVIRRI